MSAKTCAACDCKLDANAIKVKIGGKAVEVCCDECGQKLKDAHVSAKSARGLAMNKNKFAATRQGVQTASVRISYLERGNGPMSRPQSKGTSLLIFLMLAALLGSCSRLASASDHLDSPTVIADPSADIGDTYGWISADGHRLNLIMDIVGRRFSDKLQYVFRVDSGSEFGKTSASILIVCQFDVASTAECWTGSADYLHGDASKPEGVEGQNKRFRIFAGLRDDPFFNNVKGTRAALGVADAALQHGTRMDSAGCPLFDDATSKKILDLWKHTDGGPAMNFLAGWKSSSLIISVDLDLVSSGGKLLAVWGAVHKSPSTGSASTKSPKNLAIPELGEQIERVGRPLTKNALIGLLMPNDVSDKRKEEYNRAAPARWSQFTTDLERSLGLYDGFDGKCGNGWLADRKIQSSKRYHQLAKILSDDRLWINSASRVCTQFLAVEFSAFGTPWGAKDDCGGRTPNYDAIDVLRSLWANGAMTGIDDGVDHDDHVHSTTEFPFLAVP
jgi:hypothetical protein